MRLGMTTAHLLVGIILGVAAQVAILLGIVAIRVRRELRASRARAARLAPIPMRVLRKTPETAEGSVCSFLLAPVGQPVPTFLPGQYLTIHARPDGEGAPVQRCYSLSNAPGEGVLRISVKRVRSDEHTSELQSLMRISYAVFCLKTKNIQ